MKRLIKFLQPSDPNGAYSVEVGHCTACKGAGKGDTIGLGCVLCRGTGKEIVGLTLFEEDEKELALLCGV